jgi:hypothetical protein
MSNDTYKKWILSLPKEKKLELLDEALKKEKFNIFIGLTQILLDAPIVDGGISSSEINEIYKKYNP